MKFVQMAAGSALQSAVVEEVVIWLPEQLTAKQQIALQTTTPSARYACPPSRSQLLPMFWKLAIISETFPVPHGHVRVATMKTNSGQLKRPIHKLVLLLVELSRNLIL
jgi:hypothetical protein